MHAAAGLMWKTEGEGMETSRVVQADSQNLLISATYFINSFIYWEYVDEFSYAKHCFSLQTALNDQNWYTSAPWVLCFRGKSEGKWNNHVRLVSYVGGCASSG